MNRININSEETIRTYKTARNQIIKWGAITIAIYLVYVIIFPLLPAMEVPGKMLDMEMLLKKTKWMIWIYIFGLGMLFYAYWRMIRAVHAFPKEYEQEEKWLRGWALGFGIFSGIILLGLYPITAIDVGLYFLRARLWSLYGANPLTALPSNFPNDAYAAIAGEFAKEPSPYGPLWEWVARIPLQLGILDIANGIIAMKTISLLAYIGTAALIGWHAQQDKAQYQVSGLTAMTFFALNPLVLLEAIGNGHNDILMIFFITLGLILWQRDQWAWAAFAFTLATLIKATGVILLPLFGVAILVSAKNWRTRILRGLGILAIFMSVSVLSYRVMGPFPDVFLGTSQALFNRRGFTPAYAVLVLSWDLFPRQSHLVLSSFNALFVVYYLYLLIALALKKITFIEAGFWAYFSQLMLGSVFRIWYPLWLLPFAALGLNSRAYWRAFLFSLTAELSILSYFILWRWELENWSWGLHGPLSKYWDYWRVMTLFTVPWTFGVPFLGSLLKRKNQEQGSHSLEL